MHDTGLIETDDVLALIVEETRGLLGADVAGLRLLEGRDLVLRASTDASITAGFRPRVRLGESLTGETTLSLAHGFHLVRRAFVAQIARQDVPEVIAERRVHQGRVAGHTCLTPEESGTLMSLLVGLPTRS